MIKRLIIATLFLACISPSAYSLETVKVAVTSVQPPFVINPENRVGLAYDLIDVLNGFQSDFHFVDVFCPPLRLLTEAKRHTVDLIAFNNANWGWTKNNAVGSLSLTTGKDLFYSLKGRSNDNRADSIAAVRGYHYTFAQNDPNSLFKRAEVTLVNDEPAGLQMVVRKRTKTGIASEAFLNWIKSSEPDVFKRLSINPIPDQAYERHVVVFPHSPINVDRLNTLLTRPIIAHALERIFADYELPPPFKKN